jgi:DNA-binding FadR family transcriptional regulator
MTQIEMIHGDIFTAVHSPNPLKETMERVAGAIRARLLSPGDRLPAERDLAHQLGVSRSTLRVALQALAEEGWLEVRRGRHGGSFVARWPVMPGPRQLPTVMSRYRSRLPALLDYRRAVESAAAAFAAERATAADVNELEALAQKLSLFERNYEAYRAYDARFHISISRAARSPRLMESVTEVQAALTEILDAAIYYSESVLHRATADHCRILRAIGEHDTESARQLMLDHVMATEQVIYSFFTDGNPPVRCREAAS